jgi:hypothetical protein
MNANMKPYVVHAIKLSRTIEVARKGANGRLARRHYPLNERNYKRWRVLNDLLDIVYEPPF